MVLEIVEFILLPQISATQFLEAHQQVHLNWVRHQPGFLRRETVCNPEGIWKDVVSWESLAHAQEASERLMQEAEALPWMQMMDPESIVMYHGELMVELPSGD